MKRNIRIASLAMWVSLIGLLSFQGYWISTAYTQKKKEIESEIKDAFSKANNGLLIRKLGNLSGMEVHISADGGFFSPDTIIIANPGMRKKDLEVMGHSLSYSMTISTDDDEEADFLNGNVLSGLGEVIGQASRGIEKSMFMSRGDITEADFSFMDSLLGAYLEPINLEKAYVLTFGHIGSEEFQFPRELPRIPKSTVRTQSLIQPLSFGARDKMAKLIFPEREVVKSSLSSIGLIIFASVIMLGLFVGAWYYIVRSLQRQYQLTLMKDDFISNMTHELKTPVTASSLALEVIAKNDKVKSDTQLTSLIGIAKSEQQRMLGMIDTILESTTQNGMPDEDLSELCINEELEAISETIRMKVNGLDGTLSLLITPERLKVRASQVHLQNAIINILENAIKYANGAPHIKVGLSKEGKMAVLAVVDQGVGIGKEDQKRIFEKFFRVHTGNVHTIKGYGLGLSYTKAVIEGCGGDIEVSSELNKGTTFTIKLPLLHDS